MAVPPLPPLLACLALAALAAAHPQQFLDAEFSDWLSPQPMVQSPVKDEAASYINEDKASPSFQGQGRPLEVRAHGGSSGRQSRLSQRSAASEFTLDIPEKFLEIPHSKKQLRHLTSSFKDYDLCKKHSKRGLRHAYSQRKGYQRKIPHFVLCLRKLRQLHKKHHSDISQTDKDKHENNIIKMEEELSVKTVTSNCSLDTISWGYAHMKVSRKTLEEFHCWNNLTSRTYNNLERLLTQPGLGIEYFRKLTQLKCQFQALVTSCKAKFLSHTSTMPSTTTESTTPTSSTVPPTTAQEAQKESKVPLEVLRELQRDMGIDYDLGVFDEPFLFY